MIKLTIVDRNGLSSVRFFSKAFVDLAFEASQAWTKLGFAVRLSMA